MNFCNCKYVGHRMQLTVLDKIQENDASCLLCKTNLLSYVKSLPIDYNEFYIQRDIVNNAFLDNLWDSIVSGQHIPNIVLVTDEDLSSVDIKSDFSLSNFQILDGLQRSHRLIEIWRIISFIAENSHFYKNNRENLFGDREKDEYIAECIKLSRAKIKDSSLSLKLFKKIFTSYVDGVDLEAKLHKGALWVELWSGMTDELKIKKMLVLNAGQKSVNIKHQIELLFWSNIALFEDILGKSNLFREKQANSMLFSRKREQGQFHFAHIVSAFLSLQEAKALNTNTQYTADATIKNNEENSRLINIDSVLLTEFAHTLKEMDRWFASPEQVRWLGREVVLVGIFAGIGEAAYKGSSGKNNEEESKNRLIIDQLKKFRLRINELSRVVNISNFDNERDLILHSQVNVGNVNRTAVQKAIVDFQKSDVGQFSNVDWSQYFKGGRK